jgi:hypothetical protein
VKKLDFGGDFEFPISFIVDEYREYSLNEKTRTEPEIKKIIETQIEDIIKNKLDKNAQIIDKNVKYTVLGDKVTAKVVITTIEDINKEIEIGRSTISGAN